MQVGRKSERQQYHEQKKEHEGIAPEPSFLDYRKGVMHSTGQEGYGSETPQQPCNFLLNKFSDTWQLVINYCARR